MASCRPYSKVCVVLDGAERTRQRAAWASTDKAHRCDARSLRGGLFVSIFYAIAGDAVFTSLVEHTQSKSRSPLPVVVDVAFAGRWPHCETEYRHPTNKVSLRRLR
ncbi:hypothetical protein N657DRAFT_354722 [Parathielavia appendiculata]|uniref:Uncharacterized protein n=1 Tax=Parathielavia appendiculata TaxID=2587402 RepID=A0AAN6U4T9_9PEZI|nr:hypothetical protein N657DRAFT_354722 [Parathielavia appendiculata]